jgi:predicted acyltransferase
MQKALELKEHQNKKSAKHFSSKCIVSVDIFRGMTIAAMIMVISPGSWKYIYPQLHHANWHGCTFTDLSLSLFFVYCGNI